MTKFKIFDFYTFLKILRFNASVTVSFSKLPLKNKFLSEPKIIILK
jgi:hypothetical protein